MFYNKSSNKWYGSESRQYWNSVLYVVIKEKNDNMNTRPTLVKVMFNQDLMALK